MYSEIVILGMLRERSRHGYEIKKDVERALGGTVSMNNKSLYPALKHFEELGAVVRQVVEQEGRPNRHLYRLTERGVELLHSYMRDFSPELAASDAEFFTRVAFFDLLELEERLEILKMRRVHVQQSLEHLDTLRQMADEANATSYAQRVLAFTMQQNRSESQWLTAWLEEMRAGAASE